MIEMGQSDRKKLKKLKIKWSFENWEYNVTIVEREKKQEKSFKLTAVLNISPSLIFDFWMHILLSFGKEETERVSLGIQCSYWNETWQTIKSHINTMAFLFKYFSKVVLENGRFFNPPEKHLLEYEFLMFFSVS